MNRHVGKMTFAGAGARVLAETMAATRKTRVPAAKPAGPETAARSRANAPGTRPSTGARSAEARHLLKELASLAHEVVTDVTDGARSQVSHGLRAGASALMPEGVITVGRVPKGYPVEIPVIVENTTDASVAGLRFRSSALVAPGRHTIPATAVTVAPDRVDVEAGGECHLVVTVRVPSRADTGRYVGSLEGDGPSHVQATVTIDVV